MRSDFFRVLFAAGLIGLVVLIGLGIRALMRPAEPLMVSAPTSSDSAPVEALQPAMVDTAGPTVARTTALATAAASAAPSASSVIRTSRGPQAHREDERALLDERIKLARVARDRPEIMRLVRLRSDLDRNVPFPTASASASGSSSGQVQ